MRWHVWRSAAALGALVATAGFSGPAVASVLPRAPAPSASAAAGQAVCTVNDSRLAEISGLVAVDNGYVAINDSNPDPAAIRIFRLDAQCKVTSLVNYPNAARDPEDVAVAPDGTIWVADTGDNDADRQTVALWKLAPNEKVPVIHRVTYPDGPRDAEALLIDGDGMPVIVTKGRPALYKPAAALVPRSASGTQLKKIGEFEIPQSSTPNGLGPPGRLVITGGANAPDGKRVVLRTYADALEWDVPDGDVGKAVTGGKPRVTPLPNEPQGESITYTRDGAAFVTASEVTGGRATPFLRYSRVPAATPAQTRAAAGGGDDSGGFTSNLTIDDITYLVAAVGGLGLVLVLVGVLAIRRSRVSRRSAARAAKGGGPGGSGGPRGGGGGRRGPDDGPRGGGGVRGAARAPARSFDDFDDLDDPPSYGGATGDRGGGRGGGGRGGRGGERTGSIYRTGDIHGGSDRDMPRAGSG